ncbi:MAG: NUDIX hydrolase [Dehalococcoidia bacterium]
MADLESALKARHPDRFKKHRMMIAVASVIVEDGKLLLICDPHGFWASVGGWVEEGERPDEAVIREVREEIGVDAEVMEVLHPHLQWQAYRSTDDAGFLLFVYRVRLLSRDFKLLESECSDVRWVGRDEWADLPMLPYVRSLLEERADEWLG